MRSRRLILVTVTVSAAAWAAALTFTGGLSFHTPWGPVSSHNSTRPLAIAIAAALFVVFLDARVRAEATGERSGRWARRLAGLIAILVLLAAVRFGTFTAGGSDPSGYVSEAALWRTGRLVQPAPEWIASAAWPRAEFTAAPLGYAPGPTAGTQVPVYPAGLPLLMALAHTLGGTDAEFYVVPLFAAVLVWASFLLGARLNGPWSGVVTSALVATSPPFLLWVVMPMSDVPVAACWTVALVCALSGSRSGGLRAGAATALAVAIRPNLAPLAVSVAAVLAARASERRTTVSMYLMISAIGIVLVATINHALYGSPLRSGYGELAALYSTAFVGPNLQNYGSWFVAAQTAVPLIGLLAPLSARTRQQRLTLLAISVGMPLLTLCLYLPYRPFDGWWYLRFLLPAYPALFAGAAIVIDLLVSRLGKTDWVRFGAAAGVSLLALRGLDYSNAPTDLSASEPRYRRVAEAAGSAAPAKTVFISFQHSGSLRYYTGHDILRWDLMNRVGIDQAVEHLSANGYRVYWVGEATERQAVQQQFAGTRFLTQVQSGRRRVIDDVWLVDLQAGE